MDFFALSGIYSTRTFNVPVILNGSHPFRN